LIHVSADYETRVAVAAQVEQVRKRPARKDGGKSRRTAMQRGAPGGGFILGPSHSVAANTKYDNFAAMLDEFVRLRDKY
jgi:hypothetical protein